MEDEIIRAYSDEIVSLHFDGYSAWQAIEFIKSCIGVIECRIQPLDVAAPTGNVQIKRNV